MSVGCHALLFELVDHQVGDASGVRAAEGDFDGRDVDFGEQLIEVSGREVLLGDSEAQRIDARVEEFERFGVGLLGAFDLDGLMHVPAVVGARTSHVGELACLRAQEPDAFEVFGAVVGADIEALARTPYQFTLVIGTFQVGCDRRFPDLGRDRGEFGEQLFTFGICHNCLEISMSVYALCFKLHVKVRNNWGIVTRNC